MELLLCDFQAHCLHLGFHLVESNTELWPGKWILKTALRHISFHVQNVKPDRVIFNTLINACGRAGAVERAFDVLSDMKAEATPVKPDHVTYGALIAACARGGQVRSLFIHKGAALQRVPQAQEGVCASVASEWVGE
jgi:pentatricopeptide repeat protein